MIIGIGTDIVEIDRIVGVLSRQGESFIRRILTPTEQKQLLSKKDQARFLAKRFAAKEAASKALGTGFSQGVSWQDFEVSSDELGRPLLSFSGQAKLLIEQKGVTESHLSISDEKHYAIAFAVYSKS
ncbi:MAG: holo-ACP synthase [Pseudomonadales bacterium]|nr:holo-ACP synthase [Pseudomonadales bacterium]